MQPHRVTALYVHRELAWFRVRGYGLWVKWGSAPDLHVTRKTAHYLGRLRWKVLRPGGMVRDATFAELRAAARAAIRGAVG